MDNLLRAKVAQAVRHAPMIRHLLGANLTVPELEAERALAQATLKRSNATKTPGLVLTLVLSVCGVYYAQTISESLAHAPDLCAYLFFLLVFSIGGIVWMIFDMVDFARRVITGTPRAQSFDPAYLQALTPIAGTAGCLKAESALKDGGPDVAAWRDAAIAERGQLYGLDVTVMGALQEQYLLETSEVRQRTRIAEACTFVHGTT